MERLTHKINNIYLYNVDEDVEIGNKLGQLEDIMEKYYIEDLEMYIESLKLDIEILTNHKDQAHDIHIKNLELKQENQILEQALRNIISLEVPDNEVDSSMKKALEQAKKKLGIK